MSHRKTIKNLSIIFNTNKMREFVDKEVYCKRVK